MHHRLIESEKIGKFKMTHVFKVVQ
jgi:hypothetical protein